jgi:two-component system sensor histidine kinase/response regulator
MILKAFTLLALFSISFISVNGQSRFEKDSSWKRFEKMKDDTIKVMSLFEKSLHASVNDLELSGFYAKKTYELASKLKFNKGIIYSSDLLGNHYLQNGKYDKAYEWMNKSIRLKEKMGDPFQLAIGYNQLAVLFRQMQNFEMAIQFARKSIVQSKLMQNDRFISLSTSTLSNIYYESKKYDSCLFYSEIALKLNYKNNDSTNIALLLSNQSRVYNDIHNYDKAIQKSLEGKKYIHTNDLRLKLACEINLASSYLSKGNLNESAKSFQLIFSITKDFYEIDQLILVYKLYADFLFKKGNYKEAYEYKSNYQVMQDSIDDVNIKKEIAGNEIKYQSEKKEKENQLLKQKSEIDQLTISENERKSFQLKLIIGASAIVSILLIFVIMNRIRTSRKLAEQNEQINKQNNTLKVLNRDLIESEDNLQQSNKVKSELLSIISHDISSPVNSLYTYQDSIISKINSLSKEELSNDFIRINEQTKQVHTLVNNLLDYCYTQQNGFIKNEVEINLAKLINENIALFEQTIESKSLKINISSSVQVKIKSDLNLLRLILRNLISNAIKFSPTGEKIDISLKENILFITNKGNILDKWMIENIKTGNNTESKLGTSGEKGTGLGMKIVRNATQLLGTDFIIETHPQKGNSFGIRI